jgi:hypothetical protein
LCRHSSSREITMLGKFFSNLFSLAPHQTSNSLGPHDKVSPYARHRYTSTFGPVPLSVQFGNHTLLFIDAPLLVDEEKSPGPEASPALARIDQLASGACPGNKSCIDRSHVEQMSRDRSSSLLTSPLPDRMERIAVPFESAAQFGRELAEDIRTRLVAGCRKH